MKFSQPLQEGKILKRYKRFFADIQLNNEIVVAHVPNTGSMKTCWEPGWKALVSFHDDPKRKLKYTLEMTSNGKSWIGVNTSWPNKLAQEAISSGHIKELLGYSTITPEKTIGESRIDLYLTGEGKKDCYVEIKNVTLAQNQIALFPDAVSERGQKHLRELTHLSKSGHRACMLFIVQREDVTSFKPADAIDPEYGKLLREAAKAGVEILVYQCHLDVKGISLSKSLPYDLDS
jgi:sugar fermentation stimulation protein A